MVCGGKEQPPTIQNFDVTDRSFQSVSQFFFPPSIFQTREGEGQAESRADKDMLPALILIFPALYQASSRAVLIRLMKDGTEAGAVEKPPFLTPDFGGGAFSIIFSREVDCDVSQRCYLRRTLNCCCPSKIIKWSRFGLSSRAPNLGALVSQFLFLVTVYWGFSHF